MPALLGWPGQQHCSGRSLYAGLQQHNRGGQPSTSYCCSWQSQCPPRARPRCSRSCSHSGRSRSWAGSRARAAAQPAAPEEASERLEAQTCVVLGTQWGDEGKGKLVDILAQQYDIVARGQGGANAGHTIYDAEGTQFKLHLIPSGILHRSATCVIGNGVVVHLPSVFDEIAGLEAKGVDVAGRLRISDRAHLLFDLHKQIDGLREAELAGGQIGTTKRGIGPAYASKATRNGLRVGALRDPAAFREKLRTLALDGARRFEGFDYDVEAEVERYAGLAERVGPFVTDTVALLHEAQAQGRRILVEGANATMLDIDFGTYPFVTSSNPSIGGVACGLGLAPTSFGAIIGVAKAYTTRVGAGPYPTELHGAAAEDLRRLGAEYGTTTGRPRRVGWLDLPALCYAARINGLTDMNLTKLDVLSELETLRLGVGYRLDGRALSSVPAEVSDLERVEVVYEELPGWRCDISQARQWSDLPEAAQRYVQRIQELTGVHNRWIGVGPGRDAIVVQPKG